jgi:predicted tellurium resistance membrane protein TerC
VDKALAIAALARHLPERQQIMAFRFGIIGAYSFRGLIMAFAAWIIANPWLKIAGASYLVNLMCEYFAGAQNDDGDGENASNKKRSFIATIIAIEAMDLNYLH